MKEGFFEFKTYVLKCHPGKETHRPVSFHDHTLHLFYVDPFIQSSNHNHSVGGYFCPALEKEEGFGALKELVQVAEIGFGFRSPASSTALFPFSAYPVHRVWVLL